MIIHLYYIYIRLLVMLMLILNAFFLGLNLTIIFVVCLIFQLFSQLSNLSIKCQKLVNMTKSEMWSLQIVDQQFKPSKYSVYHHVWQRKPLNDHIWESETSTSGIFAWKSKMINRLSKCFLNDFPVDQHFCLTFWFTEILWAVLVASWWRCKP